MLYNRLNVLWKAETRQGMRSVLAKMKGVTGELALILHRLNAAIANQPPSVEVNGLTMSQAIALAQYYLYQVKLIHADAEGETVNGNPTGKLKKILELSERVGVVSAREVKNGIWHYRKTTPEEIRSDFFKLEAMGYGQIEGTGNRLKFKTVDAKLKTVEVYQQNTETPAQWSFEKPESKTVDATVDATVEVIKKAKTPVTQAVQSLKEQTVDVVDEIHNKSRELKDSQPLEQKTREGDSKDQLMEFYQLKRGDLLIEEDSTGSLQTIQLADKITHSNSWKTNKKNQFISLDDWRTGRVRKPTVEDVATLIKSKPDRKTFRWLYRNLESLQIKAIEILAEDSKNEQLIEQLYDYLNPITLNDHARKALEDLKQKMRDLGRIAQKQFFEMWGDNGLLAIQFAEEEGKIRVKRGMIEAT